MRSLIPLVALAALVPSGRAAAQLEIPSGFAQYELGRSRTCVGVIARLDAFDAELAPLAARTERLLAVGQAIALEERAVMDSLNAADPVEKDVRDWFAEDGTLAQRFVEEGDSTLIARRAVAREAIKSRIATAVQATQDQARAVYEAAGTLPQEAAPCEGAILIRSAVLEACATQASPVCEAAASSQPGGAFRFVESPEGLWDIEERRPWTEPGPLVVGPNGLDGARTLALARSGNLALTLSFGPLLRQRGELSAAEIERFAVIDDSLGIVVNHPEIAVVPALRLRALAPESLAGETLYVLHFGTPETADVVWSGPAGTGAAISAVVVLGPREVFRLSSGEPLSFTAVKEGEDGDGEALYTIPFLSLNQGQATTALLGYMVAQLSTDLNRLIPPTGR